METINQQLDGLFKKWKRSYNDHPEQLKLFATDGLVYKYNKKWEFKKEAPTLAGTDADIFVEDEWNKSPLKVVFLLKDKSDESGGDVRQWFLYDNVDGDCSRNLAGRNVGRTGFLPNMARILYGIRHIKTLAYIDFKDFKKKYKKDIVETWNTLPFAFVETKKIAGTAHVSDKTIQEYLDSDGGFLKDELDYLKPNVIICTCDPQFDFITEKYLANEIIEESDKKVYDYDVDPYFNCCLWYYKKRNLAVVKSYHPTNRGKIQWTIFERVVSPFRRLLKENPEFFENF